MREKQGVYLELHSHAGRYPGGHSSGILVSSVPLLKTPGGQDAK